LKKDILSVTQLTENVKSLLESSFGVFWVEGEVSNLRWPASGHLYFTLKDELSQVRAVIFRLSAATLRFAVEDGMHIVCRARLSVYAARGEYQIIIDTAEPLGVGALQIAFEQLKARLGAEGLFSEVHKKPIPFIPRRVGVVTSPSGAVIRDILNITRRRFKSVDILIAPVKVQGPEAPQEIVRAIAALHSCSGVDVIILARGGGSLEDLAAFNDEKVARAIFAARIPVISAVGHEVDYTIADFVADLRAPTPSAAAELTVPIRRDLCEVVDNLRRRLYIAQKRLIREAAARTTGLAGRLPSPGMRIAGLRLGLDDKLQQLKAALVRSAAFRRMQAETLDRDLRRAGPLQRILECRNVTAQRRGELTGLMRGSLNLARQRLAGTAALLDSLSPLSVLARGYAIALTEPAGRVIMDAGSVLPGDAIRVKVARGDILASVKRTVGTAGELEKTEGGNEEGKV
jgi:exodeoxyribonuclease VII large subunit